MTTPPLAPDHTVTPLGWAQPIFEEVKQWALNREVSLKVFTGLVQLSNGVRVEFSTGTPKREMAAVVRRLRQRHVAILSGVTGNWRMWWFHYDGTEAFYTTDVGRMYELLGDRKHDTGYRLSRNANRVYGEYHSVRDGLCANPATPTTLLVELLHLETRQGSQPTWADSELVDAVRARANTGDPLAALSVRMLAESDALAGLELPELWETFAAILPADYGFTPPEFVASPSPEDEDRGAAVEDAA